MEFRQTKVFDAIPSAKESFRGLPTTRMEPWKYTSLRSLEAIDYEWQDPRPTWSGAQLDWTGDQKARFSVFDELRSHHSIVELGIDSLSTLAHLHLTGGRVDLEQSVTSASSFVPSLLWITVADGADAEVHLSLIGKGLRVNAVVIELGRGSRCLWQQSNRLDADASLFTATHVSVPQDAQWKSLYYDAGGRLSRHDLEVSLHGSAARADLDGAYLVAKGSLVDHHTIVQHRVPKTVSRQRYKGIVSGRAVFNGRVNVLAGASQCSAKQLNKSVLVHKDAEVNTKPELRIDHDDVECSHGAAIGALDPQQLFYLQSRGIKPADAQVLLTEAFMGELLQQTPVSHWREDIKTVYEA